MTPDRPPLPLRTVLLVVLALAAVTGLSFQGSRGLWRSSESRYAEVAREMLVTDNYLSPQLNFKPHFTKPPLTYWTIALGLKLFGVNEWGARVFNAAAFILTALLVAGLGKLLWDTKTALFAGIIYATALMPMVSMHALTTDTFLTLFETLVVFFFWCAIRCGDSGRARLWVLAMWAALGLAFLTKGPPCFLPFFSIAAFWLVRKKQGAAMPPLFTVPALIVFAVVGLTWYVIVCSVHEGLLGYFLNDEMLRRISTSTYHRGFQWYFALTYLPLLLAGLIPWLFLLPAAYRRFRGAYEGKPLLGVIGRNPRLLFLALWFLISFTIFTVAQTRLPLYILPLFPVAALIAGRGIAVSHTAWPPGRARKAALLLGLWVALLVGLKYYAAHHWRERYDYRRIARSITAQIPGDDYEIGVCRRSLYHGLNFYLGRKIEYLALWDNDVAYLAPKKAQRWSLDKEFLDMTLNQKLTEMQHTSRRHLLLFSHYRKGHNLRLIKEKVRRAGFTHHEAFEVDGRLWGIVVLPEGSADTPPK